MLEFCCSERSEPSAKGLFLSFCSFVFFFFFFPLAGGGRKPQSRLLKTHRYKNRRNGRLFGSPLSSPTAARQRGAPQRAQLTRSHPLALVEEFKRRSLHVSEHFFGFGTSLCRRLRLAASCNAFENRSAPGRGFSRQPPRSCGRRWIWGRARLSRLSESLGEQLGADPGAKG